MGRHNTLLGSENLGLVTGFRAAYQIATSGLLSGESGACCEKSNCVNRGSKIWRQEEGRLWKRTDASWIHIPAFHSPWFGLIYCLAFYSSETRLNIEQHSSSQKSPECRPTSAARCARSAWPPLGPPAEKKRALYSTNHSWRAFPQRLMGLVPPAFTHEHENRGTNTRMKRRMKRWRRTRSILGGHCDHFMVVPEINWSAVPQMFDFWRPTWWAYANQRDQPIRPRVLDFRWTTWSIRGDPDDWPRAAHVVYCARPTWPSLGQWAAWFQPLTSSMRACGEWQKKDGFSVGEASRQSCCSHALGLYMNMMPPDSWLSYKTWQGERHKTVWSVTQSPHSRTGSEIAIRDSQVRLEIRLWWANVLL